MVISSLGFLRGVGGAVDKVSVSKPRCSGMSELTVNTLNLFLLHLLLLRFILILHRISNHLPLHRLPPPHPI